MSSEKYEESGYGLELNLHLVLLVFHFLWEVGYSKKGGVYHFKPIQLSPRVNLFPKVMCVSFTSVTSWCHLSLSLSLRNPQLLQSLNPQLDSQYTFMDFPFISRLKHHTLKQHVGGLASRLWIFLVKVWPCRLPFHFGICRLYVVTLLNWTHVYEWCMARLIVKNRHQLEEML